MQLTGRLPWARRSPPNDGLMVKLHIANSLRSGERTKRSAWAICLGAAGRLQCGPTTDYLDRRSQEVNVAGFYAGSKPFALNTACASGVVRNFRNAFAAAASL